MRYVEALMDIAKKIRYYRIKQGNDVKDIIPNGAYSRKGSLEFFRHLKRNNIKEVEAMIQADRFLIY